MRIPAILAGAALFVATVSACSDKTRQESQEAGNAIAADLRNNAEHAANVAQSTADRLSNQAEAAWKRTDDEARRAADQARNETGEALENAGRAIKD